MKFEQKAICPVANLRTFVFAILVSWLPGCGGSFNKLFGDFNLVKYDWEEIHCSWNISNLGLQNAVMLISAQTLNFKSCR